MTLKLEKLSLFCFKNWDEYSQIFNAASVCFLGGNGTGKTNLLDAIYYLCTTKSYFNNADNIHIGHSHDQASVVGEFNRSGNQEQIICNLRRTQKKIFKRNFKEYERLADHIGLIPVVMITPYDIGLIWEGSSDRRKFMDGALCQTDKSYLKNWSSLNHALIQRNSVLRSQGIYEKQLAEQLEPWNHILLSLTPSMHSQRQKWSLEISARTQEIYALISGGNELAEVIYESDLTDVTNPMLLWSDISLDQQAGRTRKGLHRDELHFMLNGRPLKKFGSQGQQKSFLLSIKLAQLTLLEEKTGQSPILLLDDIFDKIDEKRISRILTWLKENFRGQTFFTDTSHQRLPGLMKEMGLDPQVIFTDTALLQ